jgi:ribosomal protein L29
VESTLRRDHIDTRIHSVETELFNLKQHVADEQSHGKASDALYYQRIDDLNNQLAALREESARLGGP